MWTLAWRNVWRHRNRSLITSGAVALVVFTTLLSFAFIQAAKTGMHQALTDESGHLQITSAKVKEARDFGATLILHADTVEAVVRRELPDALVARTLETPALLNGDGRSRGVRLAGVDLDEPLRERFAERYLSTGRLPAPGSLTEIALGESLARALRLDLGDVVHVLAPGTEGRGSGAYTLVGLLDFPQSAVEIQAAYLSLEGAQELAAPGAATRFQVHLTGRPQATSEASIQAAKARLSAALSEAVGQATNGPLDPTRVQIPGESPREILDRSPGRSLSVETWREAAPDVAAILDLMDPFMMVFAFFIFILAGLFVVNTVYLGLIERIREFGVIIAVGADRRRVMRMVFAESLVLAVVGSAAGLISAGALVAWLSRGFTIPGMEEVMAELGLPTVLYPALTWAQVAITLGYAIGAALLAALWPARTAGRLQPVEAMKHAA